MEGAGINFDVALLNRIVIGDVQMTGSGIPTDTVATVMENYFKSNVYGVILFVATGLF